MNKNFDKKLVKLLETDSRFTDQNGRLIKRTVIDKAWQTDHQLVRLLLSDPEVKAKFFDKIAGVMVFNINTLIKYISNKNFLGNSYTRFRNKIGLNIDGKFLKERSEVSLVWPYKDCVLEGGQTKEEETRKEIFFNELLAHDEINRLFDPKVLTNWKRHTAKGAEQVSEIKRDKSGTIRENLIIKGNNLLALHTLKQQFRGKVKLIYIDPPFNTKGDANTFLYNNSFNHSSWLTFMKNRLETAKLLLKKDGVIALSIDDEEQAYLKIICDEVFGKENHIGTLIIQTKPSGRTTDTYLATSHEYVHFYSKTKNLPKINFLKLTEKQKRQYSEGNENNLFKWRDFLRTGGYSTPDERPNSFYPIYYNPATKDVTLDKKKDYIKILPLDSSGNRRVWRKTPNSFMIHLEKGEIKIDRKKNGNFKVKLIDKIKQGIRPKSVWTDSRYDASAHGTKWIKKIFKGKKVFSFPKSIYAVKDILEIFTAKGGQDIVLDFFSGSGTTAEAVLWLNQEDKGDRKFILCEQMDYINKVTVPRVYHVIKQNPREDFLSCELMKYNEAYMDKIQEAKSSKELISLWKDISKNSFLNWYVNPEVPEDALEDFIKIGEESTTLNQSKEKVSDSKTNPSSKINASQKSIASQEKPEEWKNQEYIEKPLATAIKDGKTGFERQKRLLAELLNKNQLYVHLSEIDDKDFKVNKEDKCLNKLFFSTDK